jgi:hypothetical protein
VSHSLLSPSSAPRWMRCPGSVALSYGVADTSSVYADEGTAAHSVASMCLQTGVDAETMIGQTIKVFENDGTTVRRTFVVDPDMASHVQVYVDAMRRLPGEKSYEQRVDFSEYIGVPESKGTSDTIVRDFEAKELGSHDLKFGKGVRVDVGTPEYPNEQLGLYLLGTLSENDLLEDWQKFVMGVHQPRIGADGHSETLELTRAQLMAFAQSARAAAAEAMSGFLPDGANPEPVLVPRTAKQLDELGMLKPGTKQCQFCPAAEAGRCHRLEREVRRIAARAATDEDFGPPVAPDAVPVDDLPSDAELSLMELWIKGMRSRIQRELQAGRKLKHWKLIAGKKGARQWAADKIEGATKAMKKLLKKAAFTEPELLSPTQAEIALKKLKRGKEYDTLRSYITQKDGGETVAPMDDPSPAIEKTDVSTLLDPDGDLI